MVDMYLFSKLRLHCQVEVFIYDHIVKEIFKVNYLDPHDPLFLPSKQPEFGGWER